MLICIFSAGDYATEGSAGEGVEALNVASEFHTLCGFGTKCVTACLDILYVGKREHIIPAFNTAGIF